MNAWPNKMMRLLRRMTLFADLSDDKLEDIIQNGSREQYKAGSIVFFAIVNVDELVNELLS